MSVAAVCWRAACCLEGVVTVDEGIGCLLAGTGVAGGGIRDRTWRTSDAGYRGERGGIT